MISSYMEIVLNFFFSFWSAERLQRITGLFLQVFVLAKGKVKLKNKPDHSVGNKDKD